MKKGTNTCDFSDILFVAEKLGYNWNTMHEKLRNNGCDTSYGSTDICIEEVEDIKDEDCKKVLNAFFKQYKISEVTILPKQG